MPFFMKVTCFTFIAFFVAGFSMPGALSLARSLEAPGLKPSLKSSRQKLSNQDLKHQSSKPSLSGGDSASGKTSSVKSQDIQVYKNISGNIFWTGYGLGKTLTGGVALKQSEIEIRDGKIIGGYFALDMNSIHHKDSAVVRFLKSEDFFETSKYKESVYKIKSVVAIKNKKNYFRIEGELQVRDINQKFGFECQITKSGNTFHAVADIEIEDRTLFDLKFNSAKFNSMAQLGQDLIEDQIRIQLDLIAKP